MWKKIYRTKNGKLTEDCSKRITNEAEIAAAFLLITDQRRVQMFLNFNTFFVAVNEYTMFTHYFIVNYHLD